MEKKETIIAELISQHIMAVAQKYWDFFGNPKNFNKAGDGFINRRKADKAFNIIWECKKLIEIIPDYKDKIMMCHKNMDMYIKGIYLAVEVNSHPNDQ